LQNIANRDVIWGGWGIYGPQEIVISIFPQGDTCVDIMGSRRNGPQLSTRHDDYDDESCVNDWRQTFDARLTFTAQDRTGEVYNFPLDFLAEFKGVYF